METCVTKTKNRKRKSFTLIEVIVVVAVMGLILGGLVVSMSQILGGEVMLNKMQMMEEESRFILDLFAQDAQYSELTPLEKPTTPNFLKMDRIEFILTEKKSDVLSGSASTVLYNYEEVGPSFFLTRTLSNSTLSFSQKTTLNSIPLKEHPDYKITKVSYGETESYIVSISLLFEVENRGVTNYVPIATSVVSRNFEF